MTVLRIPGSDVSQWTHEAGGHRIQRIPPTEKKGRVHTSTVTVAVMEGRVQAASEFSLDDCKISWFSGTGPGGQNRNKVMASCRLRHLPSGLVATSQTRSRHNSLEQASADLRRRLLQSAHDEAEREDRIIRKDQVGSGQRGDKIRTVQFQNDTAVDHRTGKRITADQYLKGQMDKLWPSME